MKTRVYSKNKSLNKKVKSVLDVLSSLQDDKRYRACFVFGSATRGEFVSVSDIDVKVVVKGKSHPELNHLNINGIKLDISFNSIERLREDTEKELEKSKRIPMIVESIILFDKDGDLKKLAKEARKRMKPRKYDKSRHEWIRFLVLIQESKVKRNIKTDPLLANFIMSHSLYDLLEMYYQIMGYWHVSNKKMLRDLEKKDVKFRNILVKMISSKNTQEKFLHYSKMIDHILKKIGGRVDINTKGCECEVCTADINHLSKIAK